MTIRRTFAPVPNLSVRPRQRIFLGRDPAAGLIPCWSGDRDSVAIIGPPGVGKTSGLIIPQLLYWDGPAVVASTRGDVLRATGDHRSGLAAPRGGRVMVYDPLGSERDVPSMGWSPLAGCADAAVCYRRVAEMTAAAGQGMTDGAHWVSGAGDILRAMFHAAALARRPLMDVRVWLAQQDARTPVNLLGQLGGDSAAARMWAADLTGKAKIGERERGSFYSVAIRTLESVAEPTILASTTGPDLDIDHFLASKSTLYIVGPTHVQKVLAPMIAGLVGAIAERAAEVAAKGGGRLDPPLLLSLDEVANIAPLRDLSGLVSEGGGRGIQTVWGAQTLDRLRERYGREEAAAILGASTATIVFGGLANPDDLRMFSAWEGEFREAQTTVYAGQSPDEGQPPAGGGGGVISQQDVDRQHSVSQTYRPVLPPEAIRHSADSDAWLWYRSEPAMRIEARPAGLVPAYADLAGYDPVPQVAS